MSESAAIQTTTPSGELTVMERRDGVAIITMNNPAKRNSLSTPMLDALAARLQEAAEERAVRAVILAARGEVFSSGHDMKELVGAEEGEAAQLFARSAEIMESIRLMPKPVIAQVAGLASAAGCQLVASCDLVVAAEGARFQTPGVMIGLFCSTPMVPLSRAVPAKKALEMLFTGRPISAAEAERYGLVNRVVPAAELEAAALALAGEIVQYSAYALAVGKAAFYRQLLLPVEQAYPIARETMACNAAAEDAQEGMSAFLEKRKPRWRS